MYKRMIWFGFVFAITIMFVRIGYPQQGRSPRLNDLINAAQAEGELNLVGGGAMLGEAEGSTCF